ncbi:zinc finger, PMZ-type containing protein, partial [Tanacetum coccineum]
TLKSDGHKGLHEAVRDWLPNSEHWTVFPSAYQQLEVRCGDSAFGVNLGEKTCACRLWQLSGISCIHAVAGYIHLNRDPYEGVSHCYS